MTLLMCWYRNCKNGQRFDFTIVSFSIGSDKSSYLYLHFKICYKSDITVMDEPIGLVVICSPHT